MQVSMPQFASVMSDESLVAIAPSTVVSGAVADVPFDPIMGKPSGKIPEFHTFFMQAMLPDASVEPGRDEVAVLVEKMADIQTPLGQVFDSEGAVEVEPLLDEPQVPVPPGWPGIVSAMPMNTAPLPDQPAVMTVLEASPEAPYLSPELAVAKTHDSMAGDLISFETTPPPLLTTTATVPTAPVFMTEMAEIVPLAWGIESPRPSVSQASEVPDAVESVGLPARSSPTEAVQTPLRELPLDQSMRQSNAIPANAIAMDGDAFTAQPVAAPIQQTAPTGFQAEALYTRTSTPEGTFPGVPTAPPIDLPAGMLRRSDDLLTTTRTLPPMEPVTPMTRDSATPTGKGAGEARPPIVQDVPTVPKNAQTDAVADPTKSSVEGMQPQVAQTQVAHLRGEATRSIRTSGPVIVSELPGTQDADMPVRRSDPTIAPTPETAPLPARPSEVNRLTIEPALAEVSAVAQDLPEVDQFQAEQSVLEIKGADLASAKGAPVATPADLPRHLSQQVADVARMMPDRPVELTLSPDELGRLRLTFQVDGSAMAVSVNVERPETLDLMRRHIDALAQDLRDLGYDDVSFAFTQDGAGQEAGSDKDQPQSGVYSPSDHDGVQVQISGPTPARLALGSAGGIDIRL